MEGLPKPVIGTRPTSYYAGSNGSRPYAGTPVTADSQGVYWIGRDGNIWWKNGESVRNMGKPLSAADGGFASRTMSVQASRIDDPNPGNGNRNRNNDTGIGSSSAKQLDQVQINSLNSLLGGYDSVREDMKKKAQLARDAYLKEKQDEFNTEKSKYDGKKLETLQDYGSARTKNDVSTRDTLKNLISSLAVLGMGGGKELSRQVLSASNRSNREANATQAKNNRQLDTALNDYTAGNENDVKKINDQYGEAVSKADQTWAQNRQNTLYKIADVYNAADNKAQRQQYMQEGDGLNKFISNSAFLTPSYTGEKRQMATPDLASYNQSVPQYQTTLGNTMTPVGNSVPGNVSVKAIAVNNKDFGVKPKQEGSLGYGV